MSNLAYRYYLGESGIEALVSLISLKVEPSEEMIAQSRRLASGTMTRDFITTKRSWTFSYDALTGETAEDGGLGRDDIMALYRAGESLTLLVPQADGSHETVSVMFDGSVKDRAVHRRGTTFDYELKFRLVEI